MQIFSQLDKRWAASNLGSSSLTVGRYGCTTCSVSMASDYFQELKSPSILAKNTKLYTKNGLIIWAELANIFKKFRFVAREYKYDKVKVKEYIKDPNKVVLLQVNYEQHWVVGYSNASPSSKNPSEFKVADPLSGKIVPVFQTFKNITGAAYFEKTPTQPKTKGWIVGSSGSIQEDFHSRNA